MNTRQKNSRFYSEYQLNPWLALLLLPSVVHAVCRWTWRMPVKISRSIEFKFLGVRPEKADSAGVGLSCLQPSQHQPQQAT
jgi:hypothetical protein